MYVNYARAEDFLKLKQMNVSTKGKILLARYGKIFRGDKVCKPWYVDNYDTKKDLTKFSKISKVVIIVSFNFLLKERLRMKGV